MFFKKNKDNTTISERKLNNLTSNFISSGDIWFLLILVLGLALRIPRFTESLWYDELWSTSTVLKNFYSVVLLSLTDVHPPFYPFFMFFWIKIFGDSEIAVRMPALIFGMGSIFLTYTIALKYIGKRTALLTTFLLCVSPVHIWYSQEARAYSATLFFLLLAIFSYYKIQEIKNNKNTWYIVYAIAMFSAVFCHFFIIVYPVLLSIICFLRSRKEQWAKKILKINGSIILMFMFFMFAKILFENVSFWRSHLSTLTIFKLGKLLFNWFLLGNSLWRNNYLAWKDFIAGPFIICANIFFLFIFIHGLILLYKKRRTPFNLDVILYLFALPVILILMSLIGFKKIYIERSLFVCLPFFLIIFAKGTDFRLKYIRILCTTIVIIFSLSALVGHFQKKGERTVCFSNPNWRSTAEFFSNEVKNMGEPVVIICKDERSMIPLFYYLSREGIYRGNQIQLLDYDLGIEGVLSLTDKVEILYLVDNAAFSKKEINGYLKLLKRDLQMQVLDAKRFKGINIYKLAVVN